MTKQEIYEKAIETYGEENQMNIAIEEMSELTKAICKFKRIADLKSGKSFIVEETDVEYLTVCLRNLYEEMADVEIMLEQLKIMFKCDYIVSDWKKKKIKRLAERLGMTNE